jgi:endoglucanase
MSLTNPIRNLCVVMTSLFLLLAMAGSICSSQGVAFNPIRINAGAFAPYTDPRGNVWAPETGFEDGNTIERGDIAIANTDMAPIYRTEHYSMTKFTQAVPNGNYTVKLHFAETFEGISGKGERVFSVKVQDKELKDLDIFAEVGPCKALVKTFDVSVTNGKLAIIFIPNIENPEINGIEILPR